MDVKARKPRSGEQLTLWEKLKPNHGYLSRDIYEIARSCDLSPHTAKNMLTHGLDRGYLIHDQIAALFYRSDSKFIPNRASSETRDTDVLGLDREALAETPREDSGIEIEEIEKLRRRKQELEQQLHQVNGEIAKFALAYFEKFSRIKGFDK